MNLEQRKMFYERLKDNILEVHYTSNKGIYHEIECTLKKDLILTDKYISSTSWEKTKDEIIVWNVIDQGWRSFSLNSIIEYILRTWDEEGNLVTFDYTKEDDFVIL
jgi:hypothetical protein